MRRRLLAAVFALAACLGPRAAPANCQLGGSACGDPVAIDCNGGAVCFVPWRLCSNCTCTTTATGRTCLANSEEPGTVAALLVSKSQTPGALDLAWGASCAPPGADYTIDEGTLGVWYSHVPVRCTTAGALTQTVAPATGDRYFLVAAVRADFEGSLGTGAAGAERPDGQPPCTDQRAIAPCP